MAHHQQSPADIDPQTLAESRKLWDTFVKMSRYLIVAVIAALLLMAIFVA